MDIIIESPKGSHIKYKFDPEYKLFRLNKTLPASLVFPFDFGFIPGTKGEDGDPLDVMVLSEFTGFPGCLVDCRMVGGIIVEQKKGSRWIRNDRLLGVPEQSSTYENAISLEDIPSTTILEIEKFLKNYMEEEGKEYRLLGNMNAAQVMSMLREVAY